MGKAKTKDKDHVKPGMKALIALELDTALAPNL